MYGVKFQPKCLRGIIFFAERYLKNLRYSELSEVIYGRTSIYQNTRDIQTKGQLWNDFFVFWTLKETLLEFSWFYENLSDKSETVSG